MDRGVRHRVRARGGGLGGCVRRLGLFTELHKMVGELPKFDDDPKKSNEKILEAIQMAWLEERD